MNHSTRQTTIVNRQPAGLAQIFFVAMAVLAQCASAGDQWQFAVFGDTRDTRPPGVVTGIVYQVAEKIAALSASNPCACVLFVGDAVHGLAGNTSNLPFNVQYQAFKEAIAPLYSNGIPFYPVRGNHETYVSTNAPVVSALEWQRAFSNEVPANGVSNEAFMSYSFATTNALFIGLDQYNGYASSSAFHMVSAATETWLANLLQTNTRQWVFAFGHEPAFVLAADTTNINPGCLAYFPAERDTFWNNLGDGRCAMYFCGHSHFLALGSATDYYGRTIAHTVAGNGGAEMGSSYQGNPVEADRYTEFYHNCTNYGFVWITVNDTSVTLDAYTLNVSNGTWSVPYSYMVVPEPAAAGVVAVIGYWLFVIRLRKTWEYHG